MGAVDLLSADTNGLSDPYVKVRLPSYHPYRYLVITPLSDPYVKVRLPKAGGGEHKKETKVIKNTLAPSWDERFYFPGKLSDFVGQVSNLPWLYLPWLYLLWPYLLWPYVL